MEEQQQILRRNIWNLLGQVRFNQKYIERYLRLFSRVKNCLSWLVFLCSTTCLFHPDLNLISNRNALIIILILSIIQQFQDKLLLGNQRVDELRNCQYEFSKFEIELEDFWNRNESKYFSIEDLIIGLKTLKERNLEISEKYKSHLILDFYWMRNATKKEVDKLMTQ